MLETPEGQSRINNPETQDKQWTQETEKKINKSNTKPRKLKGKMGNTMIYDYNNTLKHVLINYADYPDVWQCN
jgi:hypothetical protein